MKKRKSIDEMVDELFSGDRRAAARLISVVENETEKNHEVMRRIYPQSGKAVILGVTGYGGAGKSTLIERLIGKYRERGKRVGVVMVDPSSPFSGGALLGDRIRIQSHSQDDGVYIRSMASRGYIGGLSRATYDVIRIMEAMGNDVVIVETLGAGQDEIDVMHIAHTCLLVLTPGMGDDIQAIKAGIMEIADIIVLNKADLEGANNCLRQLEASLIAAPLKKGEWMPRVIPTVCVANKPGNIRGIDELTDAIKEHQAYLEESNAIEQVRFKRTEQELGLIFRDEVEKLIIKGLKGTGKKREYIDSILKGESDPYSIVEEVFHTYLLQK